MTPIAPPVAASAAPYSALKHRGSNAALGTYFSVSYNGSTTCPEAILVKAATMNKKRRRSAAASFPHGKWRCTTIRRTEGHDVLETPRRTTCMLRDRQFRATVRFS